MQVLQLDDERFAGGRGKQPGPSLCGLPRMDGGLVIDLLDADDRLQAGDEPVRLGLVCLESTNEGGQCLVRRVAGRRQDGYLPRP